MGKCFSYKSSTRLGGLVDGNFYGLVMRDAAELAKFCQLKCKLACHEAVVYIWMCFWQLQHVQYVEWDMACVVCAIIRSHPGQHLLLTLDVHLPISGSCRTYEAKKQKHHLYEV